MKKKKTVKELEKKLKASEKYYWSQVQQETREKERLREELKKRDKDLKNLRREINSTKSILAERNKRISELGPYAELEGLKNQFDALMGWRKSVDVRGAEFKFWIDYKGGYKWSRDGEEQPSWRIEYLIEEADELKAAAKEAKEKGKEMEELKSRLEAVRETVESLHVLLPKPKEEPEPEKKTEEEKKKGLGGKVADN